MFYCFLSGGLFCFYIFAELILFFIFRNNQEACGTCKSSAGSQDPMAGRERVLNKVSEQKSELKMDSSIRHKIGKHIAELCSQLDVFDIY